MELEVDLLLSSKIDRLDYKNLLLYIGAKTLS
jgi:hypothetical protein